MVIFKLQSLYSQENYPGMHWAGGLLGPKAGLDVMAKRKVSVNARESRSVVEPVELY